MKGLPIGGSDVDKKILVQLRIDLSKIEQLVKCKPSTIATCEKSYYYYLQLWQFCCRKNFSLAIYITGSPPVDEVSCSYLVLGDNDDKDDKDDNDDKDDKDDNDDMDDSNDNDDKDDPNPKTYGLRLHCGFSLQSSFSLYNNIWSGFGRICQFDAPFRASMELPDSWKEILDNELHRKDPPTRDPVIVAPPTLKKEQRVGEEDSDNYELAAEAIMDKVSPLFLSMFMAKGYAHVVYPPENVSLNEEDPVQQFKKTGPLTVPFQVCQPRVNHRSYTSSFVRDSVIPKMTENVMGTSQDYFGQSAIYVMMYMEANRDLENDEYDEKDEQKKPSLWNHVQILPVLDGLVDRTNTLGMDKRSIAMPVSPKEVQELARIFGVDLNEIGDPLEYNADVANFVQGTMFAYATQRNTKEEKRARQAFQKRGQVCWVFCHVLQSICQKFHGFSTTKSILQFRETLLKELGLEMEYPNNIPDLLEETRSLLHAVTALRIGVIEGLSRMLACYYHSRFMYPEVNQQQLLDRYLQGPHLARHHLFRRSLLPDLDDEDVTSYLRGLTVMGTKTYVYNPFCLVEEKLWPISKGFSKEDIGYMFSLSRVHQNSASQTQETNMQQLIKGYFEWIKNHSKKDTVAEYILDPPVPQHGVEKINKRKAGGKRQDDRCVPGDDFCVKTQFHCLNRP